MLWMIVDRIQLGQLSFDEAVVRTLQDFGEILTGAARLGADREVGMVGELLILGHLITTLGSGDAIQAWRGPSREEHDFDLGVGDVEVKDHLVGDAYDWMGSLSQLQPSPSR